MRVHRRRHTNREELLPIVCYASRTSVVERVGFTPFQLLYVRSCVLHLDVILGSEVFSERSEDCHVSTLLRNVSSRPREARESERRRRKILLWTPPDETGKARKLAPRYTGPHKVVHKIKRVKKGRVQIVNVQRMQRFQELQKDEPKDADEAQPS